MLNWGELIGDCEEQKDAENGQKSPLSGDRPHYFPTDSEKVGTEESSNHAGYREASPLSPPSPLKKQGEGIEAKSDTRAGGGAADNFSAEKTYPVSPVAVCLLLECCNHLKASRQEVIESLLMLKSMSPPEQVRAWALLCSENGIDPYQVEYPVAQSSGQGVECRGCIHLVNEKIEQPTGRRAFCWVCSRRHALLELGYAGERVLIAPQGCNDYAGRILPVSVG